MTTRTLFTATPPTQHMRRLATVTTLLVALSGCSPDESLDEGDPEEALSTPATGQATIQTIYGERDVTYEIVDGRAILEGDIDLGPVDDSGELVRPRSVVVDVGTRLWPNGDVPYQIDPALPAQSRVTTAIADIEAASSVRFRLRTMGDTDYINFTTSPSDTSTSPVGRQGGPQNVRLAAIAGTSTTTHEIMHSLGFYHEQTRSDRDDFIEVHYECIIEEEQGNYNNSPNGQDLEPYDFDSIMHYSSETLCITDTNDDCVCPTMTLLDGVTQVSGGESLSDGDINSLYRLYNRALGVDEVNDRFGSALAAGDFDNDGFQDLAVGSPLEEVSGVVSGAVLVFKGNSSGWLAPWKVLTQSGIGENEEGDRFGSALAVGDFDNNGIDDLAVGAPGEAIGSITAGAVFLFVGAGSTGLSGWEYIHQATSPALGINENGDGFGAALAVADFDLDDKHELAIGAPWEDNEPIQNNGWVFVFESDENGMVPTTSFGQAALETDETSDGFGHALAVGRLNGDSYWDLAVGSPEWGQGSGSVFVFAGSNTGLNGFQQLRQSDAGGANEDGDNFGYALAVADFSGDGSTDLAVGAPGEDIESANLDDVGRVYMFKRVNTMQIGWHHFGQDALGVDEEGDFFGTSLAAGEVWNTGSLGNEADLVVGAPGEDIESASAVNAGAAFVFSGGLTDMVGRAVIYEDNTFPAEIVPLPPYLPDSESHDDFARALCIGDFNGDGDGDLVVGVPLEDNGSGGIFLFPNVESQNGFTSVITMLQSFQKRLW